MVLMVVKYPLILTPAKEARKVARLVAWPARLPITFVQVTNEGSVNGREIELSSSRSRSPQIAWRQSPT
jgi:hypothetical protein